MKLAYFFIVFIAAFSLLKVSGQTRVGGSNNIKKNGDYLNEYFFDPTVRELPASLMEQLFRIVQKKYGHLKNRKTTKPK
jgi:hypothetical protein